MALFSQNERDLLDALNSIEVGILFLHSDLRAKFANTAFLNFWGLKKELLEGQPDFGWIIRGLGSNRRQLFVGLEVDEFIARRVALVRAGFEESRLIRLDDGRTLRVICKRLAEGGRL